MVHPGGRQSPVIDRHITTTIKFPTRPSSRTRTSPNTRSRESSRRTSSPYTSRFFPEHHRPPSPSRPHVGRYHSAQRDVRDPSPVKENDMAGELICDYDKSATVLYELLESSKWEEARSRCRSYADEARTWIVRKDKSLRVRWKLLPLHAAIIFQSPNFVVSALLEKYPAAASRKDDQGMLPLHLAFRHKQEDEDLLELLLVQYPKAVLLKDRRDRVPLEHGRDCKFSAKLMRLYADATVASSRALTGNSPKHGDHNTAETSLITSIDLSGTQRARLEADHEAAIQNLKAEHENDIQTLRKQYEERIQLMREHNNVNVRQVKLVADDERQTLIDKHNEEMNELRALLSGHVTKDKTMIEALENEIIQLQSELKDTQRHSEKVTSQYGRLHAYTSLLREQLERISQDQLRIHEMAADQQKELESAQEIRSQLIETLLQQEDANGENDRLRGTKMMEVAEKTRHRIKKLLENSEPTHKAPPALGRESPLARNEPTQKAHPTLGPSRIEVVRGQDVFPVEQREDVEEDYPDIGWQQQETTESKEQYSRVTRVEVLEGEEGQADSPRIEVRSEDFGDSKEDYGEVVRVLGDEISGITEESHC